MAKVYNTHMLRQTRRRTPASPPDWGSIPGDDPISRIVGSATSSTAEIRHTDADATLARAPPSTEISYPSTSFLVVNTDSEGTAREKLCVVNEEFRENKEHGCSVSEVQESENIKRRLSMLRMYYKVICSNRKQRYTMLSNYMHPLDCASELRDIIRKKAERVRPSETPGEEECDDAIQNLYVYHLVTSGEYSRGEHVPYHSTSDLNDIYTRVLACIKMMVYEDANLGDSTGARMYMNPAAMRELAFYMASRVDRSPQLVEESKDCVEKGLVSDTFTELVMLAIPMAIMSGCVMLHGGVLMAFPDVARRYGRIRCCVCGSEDEAISDPLCGTTLVYCGNRCYDFALVSPGHQRLQYMHEHPLHSQPVEDLVSSFVGGSEEDAGSTGAPLHAYADGSPRMDNNTHVDIEGEIMYTWYAGKEVMVDVDRDLRRNKEHAHPPTVQPPGVIPSVPIWNRFDTMEGGLFDEDYGHRFTPFTRVQVAYAVAITNHYIPESLFRSATHTKALSSRYCMGTNLQYLSMDEQLERTKQDGYTSLRLDGVKKGRFKNRRVAGRLDVLDPVLDSRMGTNGLFPLDDMRGECGPDPEEAGRISTPGTGGPDRTKEPDTRARTENTEWVVVGQENKGSQLSNKSKKGRRKRKKNKKKSSGSPETVKHKSGTHIPGDDEEKEYIDFSCTAPSGKTEEEAVRMYTTRVQRNENGKYNHMRDHGELPGMFLGCGKISEVSALCKNYMSLIDAATGIVHAHDVSRAERDAFWFWREMVTRDGEEYRDTPGLECRSMLPTINRMASTHLSHCRTLWFMMENVSQWSVTRAKMCDSKTPFDSCMMHAHLGTHPGDINEASAAEMFFEAFLDIRTTPMPCLRFSDLSMQALWTTRAAISYDSPDRKLMLEYYIENMLQEVDDPFKLCYGAFAKTFIRSGGEIKWMLTNLLYSRSTQETKDRKNIELKHCDKIKYNTLGEAYQMERELFSMLRHYRTLGGIGTIPEDTRSDPYEVSMEKLVYRASRQPSMMWESDYLHNVSEKKTLAEHLGPDRTARMSVLVPPGMDCPNPDVLVDFMTSMHRDSSRMTIREIEESHVTSRKPVYFGKHSRGTSAEHGGEAIHKINEKNLPKRVELGSDGTRTDSATCDTTDHPKYRNLRARPWASQVRKLASRIGIEEENSRNKRQWDCLTDFADTIAALESLIYIYRIQSVLAHRLHETTVQCHMAATTTVFSERCKSTSKNEKPREPTKSTDGEATSSSSETDPDDCKSREEQEECSPGARDTFTLDEVSMSVEEEIGSSEFAQFSTKMPYMLSSDAPPRYHISPDQDHEELSDENEKEDASMVALVRGLHEHAMSCVQSTEAARSQMDSRREELGYATRDPDTLAYNPLGDRVFDEDDETGTRADRDHKSSVVDKVARTMCAKRRIRTSTGDVADRPGSLKKMILSQLHPHPCYRLDDLSVQRAGDIVKHPVYGPLAKGRFVWDNYIGIPPQIGAEHTELQAIYTADACDHKVRSLVETFEHFLSKQHITLHTIKSSMSGIYPDATIRNSQRTPVAGLSNLHSVYGVPLLHRGAWDTFEKNDFDVPMPLMSRNRKSTLAILIKHHIILADLAQKRRDTAATIVRIFRTLLTEWRVPINALMYAYVTSRTTSAATATNPHQAQDFCAFGHDVFTASECQVMDSILSLSPPIVRTGTELTPWASFESAPNLFLRVASANVRALHYATRISWDVPEWCKHGTALSAHLMRSPKRSRNLLSALQRSGFTSRIQNVATTSMRALAEEALSLSLTKDPSSRSFLRLDSVVHSMKESLLGGTSNSNLNTLLDPYNGCSYCRVSSRPENTVYTNMFINMTVHMLCTALVDKGSLTYIRSRKDGTPDPFTDANSLNNFFVKSLNPVYARDLVKKATGHTLFGTFEQLACSEFHAGTPSVFYSGFPAWALTKHTESFLPDIKDGIGSDVLFDSALYGCICPNCAINTKTQGKDSRAATGSQKPQSIDTILEELDLLDEEPREKSGKPKRSRKRRKNKSKNKKGGQDVTKASCIIQDENSFHALGRDQETHSERQKAKKRPYGGEQSLAREMKRNYEICRNQLYEEYRDVMNGTCPGEDSSNKFIENPSSPVSKKAHLKALLQSKEDVISNYCDMDWSELCMEDAARAQLVKDLSDSLNNPDERSEYVRASDVWIEKIKAFIASKMSEEGRELVCSVLNIR